MKPTEKAVSLHWRAPLEEWMLPTLEAIQRYTGETGIGVNEIMWPVTDQVQEDLSKDSS